MSVYKQFLEQRQIQIKNTFDAKMRKIDQLKAHAPDSTTDPEGEAQARAHRHHLRLNAAEEYCKGKHGLENCYGPYTKGDKNGK